MISPKRIDWLILLERLYQSLGRKTAHIDELADMAEQLGLVPRGETRDSFRERINSFLARNCKSKSAQFSKVKNKSGGNKRGVYRIKPQKSLDIIPQAQPKVSTQHTGAAGEYAVMSELLFRGFNASKMTVDDGIDVVASKDGRYFHIQVKTANSQEGKPYLASIRTKAFQHSFDVFYIVVLRTLSSVRYVNDYAIFPSGEIRRFLQNGILKEGQSISLRISLESGRYYLNGKHDVSQHINDFASIC